MIIVTRLDGSSCYINPLHIEFAEHKPDLTLSMFSGRKIVVRENIEVINKYIREFYRSISLFSGHIKTVESNDG